MAMYPLDSVVNRSRDFRTISKRLDEFWRRDFSAIGSILETLFPNSSDRRMQRDVCLVERVAKEQAIFYRRKPTRSFTSSGGAYSPAAQSAMESVYRGMGVNALFKELNERAIVQRTCIGIVIPKPGDPSRRLVTRLFAPWEVEVDPDPISNESVPDAKEFRFRIPLSATHDRINFGTLTMNRREIVYNVNGTRTGVFNEEGTNPFPEGFPVFVARFGPCAPGDFFASLPCDLYDAQVSTSIAFSDVDYISRYTSHGQRVLTNADLGQAKDLRFGPDSIVGLLEDQKLEWLSTSNDNKGYLDSIELFLRHFSNATGISPSVFMKGGWSTGVSKALDLHDRDAIRQDHRLALEEAENSFIQALVLVLNHGAGEERWPRSFVEVSHHEPELPADPLALAQSRRSSMEDGLTSPSEILSTERMISRDAASELVAKNLQEYRAVRDALKEEGSGD